MTERRIYNRTLFLGVGIALLFLLLIGRLFWIQSVEASKLHEKASSVWNKSSPLEPKRGTIYDRNGKELANNAPAYTVAVNPKQLDDPAKAAKEIAPLLDADVEKLMELFSKKDKVHVEVRTEGWKVSKEVADKIEALELTGVFLVPESKRYYPNEYLAAHITGYVNKDGIAVGGLEAYYDDILRGTPGSLAYMRDAQGNELPEGKRNVQPAKHGENLILTIDEMIQHYVEEAMDEAVTRYNPKNMTIIVANPNTMEILAMSSRPHFNPNQYWNPDEVNNQKNQAIGSRFEPGSTFKIVTLAAAIEEKMFDGNEIFQSGSIKVPGATIRDWNYTGWGPISYLEGVWKSSNVAFVNLGYERLKKDKLFSYIDKFGFNAKTGIDLPGEIGSSLFDAKTAKSSEVATTSFGQGVSVTPIQQVAAVAAIANGGKLMKPYIVKEIRDMETGEVMKKMEPEVVRQVVTPQTARQVTDILEGLVANGGAPQAFMEEFRVAGKTGTAQKVGDDGKYLEGENIVSFVGFAPANKPELLIYVAVDAPNIDGPYYGSTIAAPIFKEIMQNSLRYLKVPVATSYMQREAFNGTEIPDVIDRTISEGIKRLQAAGLEANIVGEGKKIVTLFPAQGTKLTKGSSIIVVTEPIDQLLMPDLTGYALREAMDLCQALGLKVNWSGEGYVQGQSISVGKIVGAGAIELTLQPQSTPVVISEEETDVNDLEQSEGTESSRIEPNDSSSVVTSSFE